jgi:methionyl-tRNA formyltransferase
VRIGELQGRLGPRASRGNSQSWRPNPRVLEDGHWLGYEEVRDKKPREDVSNLRIAYAGHDFFAPCLRTLFDHDDADVVLFLTHPAADNNKYTRELAEAAHIPIIERRLTDHYIEVFNASGIDLLVSAAYFYKIPIDRLKVKYAVNIHPSLLPFGRGGNPLPYYIDEHPDRCGLSIHELTSVIDGGPLIIQEKIEYRSGESVDELYLKIASAAPRLLNKLICDLQNFFMQKKEQAKGSYWPEHAIEQRTIVANRVQVHDVVQLHHKFGMFGIFLELNDGSVIEATQVTGNECPHAFAAGTVIGAVKSGYIVALQDGLLMTR